jgi:hypothetical protein
MKIPTKSTMETRLQAARALFLVNDRRLLELDVHERALTHKFAEALQTVFRNWNVDCEYNREGKDLDTKTADLPEEPGKTIFPDIIVHMRGKPINLLIIEAKPSDASRKSVDYDRKKLTAYMDADGKLAYTYGLMLTFIVGGKPDVEWKWHSQHEVAGLIPS